ncbi:hypothetical protein FHU41_002151 [Psychromicrobium silvestre]|uniref:Uncharacterized protein n=1 Tax=Psychromicrobium silvestre TaxID=1645614 RepID=A0A7Y9S8E9_9MICC|nr:hypothetical protein [Psychromicrobium silvestre]NYE95901.1 hypothetical protein [Psychromicrobium silvestre]
MRIILSRSGGNTPLLAPRVAVLSNYLGCELSPEEIISDFRIFYFETAPSDFETNLRTLEGFVPTEQILNQPQTRVLLPRCPLGRQESAVSYFDDNYR